MIRRAKRLAPSRLFRDAKMDKAAVNRQHGLDRFPISPPAQAG
jgi:hypothetical protein